uniref:PHD finger protein 24-like n=1 Tax=Crassostrea virginica TaxID=6565 RepID=A0A8B8CSB7_CRAVI|nr:PHD finger protein 24-like [Crassostrea virginica]
MDQTGQKWHKFLPRAALVGSLLKHCKDHLKIRAELRDFIRDMKKDSEQTTAELREEDPTLREWYVRRRSNAATVGLTHRDFLTSKKEEEVCHVCQKEFERNEESSPCRICDKVFHKDCVLAMKDLHPSHLTAIKRANSSVGWSCPSCDDLSLLLREDELKGIIDTFDEEINPKGGQITFEEFIEYKRKQFGRQVTDEEHKQIDLEFRLVDTDGSGTIDWWEFLNFQARVKLASRDQTGLVELLTDKEVLAAKIAFARLDVNNDGSITELEARKVFEEYFSRLNSTHGKLNIDTDIYAKHALGRAMSLDVKEMGSVSWDEFLNGQAQYILAARPNMTELY